MAKNQRASHKIPKSLDKALRSPRRSYGKFVSIFVGEETKQRLEQLRIRLSEHLWDNMLPLTFLLKTCLFIGFPILELLTKNRDSSDTSETEVEIFDRKFKILITPKD